MASNLSDKTHNNGNKMRQMSIIIGLLVTVVILNVLARKYHITPPRLEIEVFPQLVEGFEYLGITQTNISMLLTSGLILVFSFIVRFMFVPQFTEIPGKFQFVLELIIGWVKDYAYSLSGITDTYIPAYGLTVGAVIIFSGFVELLGLRAPTTDFLLTASLAIIALVVINLSGVKKFGFIGRIKSFFRPVPMVGPILMITNLLIPVSLTFRLFGNILGGMIVLELVNAVAPVFIPGILNIFFVLFHAFMQTYVFLTLMFSYVNEAVED